MIGLLAAAVLQFSPAVAVSGSYVTARQLRDWCTLGTTGDVSACRQYILGVADTEEEHTTFGETPWVCRPHGHSAGDLRDLFMAALIRHPALLDNGAANAVTIALTEAFPCGAPKPRLMSHCPMALSSPVIHTKPPSNSGGRHRSVTGSPITRQ